MATRIQGREYECWSVVELIWNGIGAIVFIAILIGLSPLLIPAWIIIKFGHILEASKLFTEPISPKLYPIARAIGRITGSGY